MQKADIPPAKQKTPDAKRVCFDKLTMTFMEPVLSKVEGKDEAQSAAAGSITFYEIINYQKK